jgi:hypothetical protein
MSNGRFRYFIDEAQEKKCRAENLPCTELKEKAKFLKEAAILYIYVADNIVDDSPLKRSLISLAQASLHEASWYMSGIPEIQVQAIDRTESVIIQNGRVVRTSTLQRTNGLSEARLFFDYFVFRLAYLLLI